MEEFNATELHDLYIPPPDSHKGQNGKLLIVVGSKLFHAPAIWTAEIASRIVDMVYVSSVPENNAILKQLKGKFWNGIIVRRQDLDEYAKEADCILIGPGLAREEGLQEGDDDTRELTKSLLTELVKWSNANGQMSKVVIDGGALQCMDVDWIPEGGILTPHHQEFCRLFKVEVDDSGMCLPSGEERKVRFGDFIQRKAEEHNCVILLKGKEDIVCSPDECKVVKGGNAGMTKGGTGDVLAGLVAALACKNDPYLSACAGSYINKKAGDRLFEKVGYYYNANDLLQEVPQALKDLTI